MLAALEVGSIEVKRDSKALETGNLYIEYECWKNTTKRFEPSGLRTTEADWWCFAFNEWEMVLAVKTPRLKRLAAQARADGHTVTSDRGANPSKGILLKGAVPLLGANRRLDTTCT